MKRFGDIMEYSADRLEALQAACNDYVATVRHICASEMYSAIVNYPSPRFWVTETQASVIVSAMMKGRPVLERMHPSKREMYTEIYRRVMLLRGEQPGRPLCHICAEVVEQPAPKFYLTAGSARIMLCKARKLWKTGKKKKLLSLLAHC